MAGDQPGEIELVYLTLEDILGLYGLIIGAAATEAADHLRNRSGLESALARPAAYAHYENADLALQATVFDVWDSQESFDKFGETLIPIMAELGTDPGEPQVAEIHNIIIG